MVAARLLEAARQGYEEPGVADAEEERPEVPHPQLQEQRRQQSMWEQERRRHTNDRDDAAEKAWKGVQSAIVVPQDKDMGERVERVQRGGGFSISSVRGGHERDAVSVVADDSERRRGGEEDYGSRPRPTQTGRPASEWSTHPGLNGFKHRAANPASPAVDAAATATATGTTTATTMATATAGGHAERQSRNLFSESSAGHVPERRLDQKLSQSTFGVGVDMSTVDGGPRGGGSFWSEHAPERHGDGGDGEVRGASASTRENGVVQGGTPGHAPKQEYAQIAISLGVRSGRLQAVEQGRRRAAQAPASHSSRVHSPNSGGQQQEQCRVSQQQQQPPQKPQRLPPYQPPHQPELQPPHQPPHQPPRQPELQQETKRTVFTGYRASRPSSGKVRRPSSAAPASAPNRDSAAEVMAAAAATSSAYSAFAGWLNHSDRRAQHGQQAQQAQQGQQGQHTQTRKSRQNTHTSRGGGGGDLDRGIEGTGSSSASFASQMAQMAHPDQRQAAHLRSKSADRHRHRPRTPTVVGSPAHDGGGDAAGNDAPFARSFEVAAATKKKAASRGGSSGRTGGKAGKSGKAGPSSKRKGRSRSNSGSRTHRGMGGSGGSSTRSGGGSAMRMSAKTFVGMTGNGASEHVDTERADAHGSHGSWRSRWGSAVGGGGRHTSAAVVARTYR